MSKPLRQSLLFSLLPFALSLGAAQAAEQANATLNVSATVLDSCVVTAPTSLVFASVSNAAATNDTSSGSIVVVCTAAHTAVTIKAEGGDSASAGKRRMTGVASTSNKLPYDIFTTTGRTSAVAIDGNLYSGGIVAVSPTTVNVYGQIPSGNYAADVYSDTIRVTLNY
jgi:spore coat protein U-like protein